MDETNHHNHDQGDGLDDMLDQLGPADDDLEGEAREPAPRGPAPRGPETLEAYAARMSDERDHARRAQAEAEAALDNHVDLLNDARAEADKLRAFALVLRSAFASHVVAFVSKGRLYLGAKSPAAVEALDGLFPSAKWPTDEHGTPYLATGIRVEGEPVWDDWDEPSDEKPAPCPSRHHIRGAGK
jgi:hypothetical protein